MNVRTDIRLPRFFRFAGSSLASTALDQLIAWMLFASLRPAMSGADFGRILVASIVARCCSLSVNYRINNRLVFEDTGTGTDKTFVRFLALAATVLALSTLGVWWLHATLGTPEWLAKVVVDLSLFFLNYNMQRTWVFKDPGTARETRQALA